MNEALRLSPRDNRAWLWVHFSASAKLHLGMGEEAVIATLVHSSLYRPEPVYEPFLPCGV